MIDIEVAVIVSMGVACVAYLVGYTRGAFSVLSSVCTVHAEKDAECIAVVRKNAEHQIIEVIWEKHDHTRTAKS